MDKFDFEKLRARVKKHEGWRAAVYDDATGKTPRAGATVQGTLTIGYGRNLVNRGITLDEGERMLQYDLVHLAVKVMDALPWVKDLHPARASVIIEMAYQMGLAGLLKFRATLDAAEAGDYAKAAEQMLASKWASQTPNRAGRLAQIMEQGAW